MPNCYLDRVPNRSKKTASSGRDARWEVAGRRWPDPHRGPWEILFEWSELENGRRPCTGVRLAWVGDGEPDEISSGLVRRIPIGTLIDSQRRKFALLAAATEALGHHKGQRASWPSPAANQTALRRLEGRRLEGRASRIGRPATRGIEFYVAIAEVYRDAYQRAMNPTLAITEAHKRLGVKLSRSGAAKAVAKTRSLGLLPPTERGKARA